MTINPRSAGTERGTTGKLGGPGLAREQGDYSSYQEEAGNEALRGTVNPFADSLLVDSELSYFVDESDDGVSVLLVHRSSDGSWYEIRGRSLGTDHLGVARGALGLVRLRAGSEPDVADVLEVDASSALVMLYSAANGYGAVVSPEDLPPAAASAADFGPRFESAFGLDDAPSEDDWDAKDLREDYARQVHDALRDELPGLWRDVVGSDPRPAARPDLDRLRASDFAVTRREQHAELSAIAAAGASGRRPSRGTRRDEVRRECLCPGCFHDCCERSDRASESGIRNQVPGADLLRCVVARERVRRLP